MVSVIVPIYNVERYLRECVDSLVGQTWNNLEIILVDDGSTDGSGAICDEYAANDARVQVIHRQNGGLSCARNAGIDVAKGDFIGFVDGDDYIEKDMFAQLVAGFSSEVAGNADVKVVNVSGVMMCYEDRSKNWVYRSGEWLRAVDTLVGPEDIVKIFASDSTNHFVWTKLFSRDVFSTGIRFKEGKLDEDSLFIFQVSMLMREMGWSMVEIPAVSYCYRQRKESICSSKSVQLRIDRMENLAEMSEIVKDDPELVELVKMQKARTLVWMLNDIMSDRQTTRLYYRKYRGMLRNLPRNTVKDACDREKYGEYLWIMNRPHLWMLRLRRRAARK